MNAVAVVATATQIRSFCYFFLTVGINQLLMESILINSYIDCAVPCWTVGIDVVGRYVSQ